ncbi:MAG: Eco57I restriction-modification methylase domain-containing protein [Fusobacteriota bacterium]
MKDKGYKISEIYENKKNTKYIKYTPIKITRKMLAISFKRYFNNKNNKEALKNLKLIDISCGTGNFLVEALEFLIRISKIYFGEYKYFSSWITGYDIDKEALGISQKRLKTILKKYNLSGELNLNNENSLILDIKDKFDIVIGNPPYFGEKGNRSKFKEIKKTEFGRKYYEGKMDYFYFFIEKGMDILKKEGILTYITTNYWLKADNSKKLRKKVKEEGAFFYIEDFQKSVFKNALGQHNMIFSIEKTNENIQINMKIPDENIIIKNNYIYSQNNKIILASKKKINLFNQIKNDKTVYLKELININQGIVTGCDDAFILDEYREEFKEYLKPWYKSKDISDYKIKNENQSWVLYLDRDATPNQNIKNHVAKYKDKLSKRREVRLGRIDWYKLHWCRQKEIFENEKIIGKQRGNKDLFAYTEKSFYGSADIYFLTKKENKRDISLFYILGYLNSSFFYEWFKYNGKTKGKDLELYATPLKNTLIYYPEDEKEIIYIENLVKRQIKNETQKRQKKINNFFDKKFSEMVDL